MGLRLLGFALRHKGVVTATLLAGLLINLMVIGGTEAPRDLDDLNLPVAAQCHGGGPGCAEQPLIPPPAVGLPRFDPPAPVSFGAPILIAARPDGDLSETPPRAPERPPLSTLAA
ncbi:MAG TPA: hypothetical protein VJP07_02150 [Dehalococcoidia bacterium]|nr:hypothetical protein [Dehalococcoidia bacterium]